MHMPVTKRGKVAVSFEMPDGKEKAPACREERSEMVNRKGLDVK